MAISQAISSTSSSFFRKNDLGLSSLSSSSSNCSQFSASKYRKMKSKKIVSVMAPQQTQRNPSTTGSVKNAMTMTEKILARASEKPQLVPGDNVWVNVDVLMTHDVCGPGSIGIFKKEFGNNAKFKLSV
ncbi:3-isopropylmalate dehydratase large subunit, chloroplastic-like [Spinacia oleracea]|uniref:3-isopropylmalate dehydratase large subunit, chloroplastic-like n=1 Tax=Spinacia oleracea TaxID=3562 RepID=A0A9R0IUV1_SPIOL|nr:3-isopropylmalate dehydratase large subunit, chloroplastic-like [Spinacia oleracea]